MSKRTETYSSTDIFCDARVDDVVGIPARVCNQVARGPCAFCGMDLCSAHGETALSLNMTKVLICEQCLKSNTIDLLVGNENHVLFLQQWEQFHQRKTEATQRENQNL